MTRPNLLVVLVDQMRADAMGCAGNEQILTPNLDTCAREGTRFTGLSLWCHHRISLCPNRLRQKMPRMRP